MANICTECNYPIKKANRTMHVSCAAKVQADDQSAAEPTPIATQRECCFCHSRDTVMINGAPFCPEHEPGDQPVRARSRETFTIQGERCVRLMQITKGKRAGEWVDVGCGEPLTPSITKGNIKCKCDQPTMPRHLRNNDADDRPPMSVRYGN